MQEETTWLPKVMWPTLSQNLSFWLDGWQTCCGDASNDFKVAFWGVFGWKCVVSLHLCWSLFKTSTSREIIHRWHSSGCFYFERYVIICVVMQQMCPDSSSGLDLCFWGMERTCKGLFLDTMHSPKVSKVHLDKGVCFTRRSTLTCCRWETSTTIVFSESINGQSSFSSWVRQN